MTVSLNAIRLLSLSCMDEKQSDGSRFGISLKDAHYCTSLESSDEAIVAKVDGYCYDEFHGTNPEDLEGWLQNLDMLSDEVCKSRGECSDARQ
eukprot:8355937-Ditylum_brightwellii.AAC.1